VIFAGLLVGNLSGGFVADAFGRRAALLSMASLFCIAGTFSAFAPDIFFVLHRALHHRYRRWRYNSSRRLAPARVVTSPVARKTGASGGGICCGHADCLWRGDRCA